jgi:hypothetical protein
MNNKLHTSVLFTEFLLNAACDSESPPKKKDSSALDIAADVSTDLFEYVGSGARLLPIPTSRSADISTICLAWDGYGYNRPQAGLSWPFKMTRTRKGSTGSEKYGKSITINGWYW